MTRTSLCVLALISALFFCVPALAQNATPLPAPSPMPLAGFSAHGTLAVDANMMNSPISVNAECAVWARSRLVRFDVLKFAASSATQAANPMVNQFLPTGTISIVYDQNTRVTTMWSDIKREYYQSKAAAPSPKPKAAATPKPSEESPMDQFLRATRAITTYDTFSTSLALVGHQPINGHTSSLFHMTIQAQKHGEKLRDVSGDMAFADDLSGIPVRLWITSKGEYDGTVKLDLTSASTDAPDPSVFRVPSGFKKVATMMELFSK